MSEEEQGHYHIPARHTCGGWKRVDGNVEDVAPGSVHVRKTSMDYRLSLPLGHTLSLSARELLCISGWCTHHITELEQEAKEDEKRESKILEGRDSHLPE